jgi:ProP effector
MMNDDQKRMVGEVQQWLFHQFPKCFREDHALPLKVGILKDIFDKLPEDKSISRLQIRRALKFYTNHPAYQRALVYKTERVDLEGNVVGLVEAEHKKDAEKAMALRKLKAFARNHHH